MDRSVFTFVIRGHKLKESLLLTIIVFCLSTIIGCSSVADRQLNYSVCSNKWYALVEERVITGDGQGHGPDIGSAEWRSVVEFKLSIRGNKNNPSLESEQWCQYINDNFIK